MVSFPLGTAGVNLPVEGLARVASFATQALCSGNAKLLGGVLDRCKLPPPLKPDAARQLAVGFALSHLFHPLAPPLEPAACEKVISSLASLPVEKNPLHLGGLLALGLPPLDQAPKFRKPPIAVYSDPSLAPAGQEEVPCCRIPPNFISSFWLEGAVDMRDLRFIHTLSEGRASELVAEKVARMQEQLRELGQTCSWERDAEKILRTLTQGDKYSLNDQIRVGATMGVAGSVDHPFYVLNGHRRLAALCILTLLGEIPLEALTRIPIWVQWIRGKENIKTISAGLDLVTEKVLAEVEVEGYVAAEAMNLLDYLPRRELQIRPLDPLQVSISSHVDMSALWHSQRVGWVPMGRRPLALLALQKIANSSDPNWHLVGLLRDLFHDDEMETELWKIVESVDLNDVTVEILQYLHGLNPIKVLSHVEQLLNGPVTRKLLTHAADLFWQIGALRHRAALARFSSHSDPKIREWFFGSRNPIGQALPEHLKLLVTRHHQETNDQLRKEIEVSLEKAVSDAWKLIHRSPDGQVSPTSLQIFREEYGSDAQLWRDVSSLQGEGELLNEARVHAGKIATLLESSPD